VGLDGPPQNHVLHGDPEVLRDAAKATNFWLLMGYNFGCILANGRIFDSACVFAIKLSNEAIADFEFLSDVAMATIFLAFYIWDAHWRHLANTTEPSCVCCGDAALSLIT